MHEFVQTALSVHLPNVLRWGGSLARLLRRHSIGLNGKGTGSATTDALTLADLSVQELILGALRDCDPVFRHCRIDAEESTVTLNAFPAEAPLTIGIDPIDGTRKYRDHDGDGYAILVHLRTRDRVLYSLVLIPESGPSGTWIEASDRGIVMGSDDLARSAGDVVRSLPRLVSVAAGSATAVYVNGFQQRSRAVTEVLAARGVKGLVSEQIPGCPMELVCQGELGGALVHSPNVYDFPILLHLIRSLGGDARFVASGSPVDFEDIWIDDRAKMRRLSGVIAAAIDPGLLDTLCTTARDWTFDRYDSGTTVA